MFPEDTENEYFHILQSIEMAVVAFYRDHHQLNDNHMEKIYNGIQRTFDKEIRGKNPPKLRLNEMEQDLFEQIEVLCRLFVGEVDLENVTVDLDPEELPTEDKSAIVDCMKRLRKSIKTWSGNVRGNRGYLDYISQFM